MDFEHYLEVELPRLYLASAVATLGGVRYAEYVTSYRLIYSVDGQEWNNATVDGSQVISLFFICIHLRTTVVQRPYLRCLANRSIINHYLH